jgi:hypothetical protein
VTFESLEQRLSVLSFTGFAVGIGALLVVELLATR